MGDFDALLKKLSEEEQMALPGGSVFDYLKKQGIGFDTANAVALAIILRRLEKLEGKK